MSCEELVRAGASATVVVRLDADDLCAVSIYPTPLTEETQAYDQFNNVDLKDWLYHAIIVDRLMPSIRDDVRRVLRSLAPDIQHLTRVRYLSR